MTLTASGNFLGGFAISSIGEVPSMAADSDDLLHRASQGDAQARDELFAQHRDQLRRSIAVRLNRRLAARLDPSDLVQEVLIKAHQQLAGYLQDRPLPFYAWLRQLAT
jgi:RNA polymerase sigma-70 factor (ECF subfamily)